jgi:hypothetical protein
MGKSTISMAMFNSNLLVYQRVSILKNHGLVGGFKPSKAWGSNHRSWNHSDSGNISVYSNLVTPQEIETWTFLLPRIWRRVSNRSIFLGGNSGAVPWCSHIFSQVPWCFLHLLVHQGARSRTEKQQMLPQIVLKKYEEVKLRKWMCFLDGLSENGEPCSIRWFIIILPYYFHIKVAINWWLFSYPFSHNPNIVLLVISPS